MELLSVADDGTTDVRLTDAEAHALRNVLPDLTGSPVAHALQRHLAMAHGEIGHQHGATPDAGHQPYCVAATQGCCSCEEPTA